jgi:tripartite-type tricarboxylate transporter receptor subunit TctC
VLPDVPALGETLAGYEASAWFGIAGPKRIPEEIIEKLNKEINVSIADPKFQAQLWASRLLAGRPPTLPN